MIDHIGVMQGRLLPKFKGRYQAHPLGYWQEEFPLAKEMGLSYIEFILDYNEFHKNPLTFEAGIEEIKAMIQKTGVGVRSICADYFMEAPLHSSNKAVAKQSTDMLNKLIINAKKIGATDIVIPCVDQSALLLESDKKRLLVNLEKSIELAIEHSINLALETDLPPTKFADLLSEFDSKCVRK